MLTLRLDTRVSLPAEEESGRTGELRESHWCRVPGTDLWNEQSFSDTNKLCVFCLFVYVYFRFQGTEVRTQCCHCWLLLLFGHRTRQQCRLYSTGSTKALVVCCSFSVSFLLFNSVKGYLKQKKREGKERIVYYISIYVLPCTCVYTFIFSICSSAFIFPFCV